MNLNLKLNKYRTRLRGEPDDSAYDDDTLAPVMPAIDVVQQLIEEESKQKKKSNHGSPESSSNSSVPGTSSQSIDSDDITRRSNDIISEKSRALISTTIIEPRGTESSIDQHTQVKTPPTKSIPLAAPKQHSLSEIQEEEEVLLVRNNPLLNLINSRGSSPRRDEYEFIPKSVILDVYSNDPEVKRFLKQLPRIYKEAGYNEQDYKCYSCRRPIGLAFGQSRLCHFDGHHYCSECHLSEKSVIPARILCNWDFNKYPISKRNQHFLTLISNEPMFELKKVAPLLYKKCPELREVEELRRQAFFIRSYCTTCADDSISFELTKLIWPREHLIKQIDLYSLEDLVQVKSGTLKQVLNTVISFGRKHVLSCVLCRQKGFICELCKSSRIIYPFDTESVHRCNECQSIYHRNCFRDRLDSEVCPRCRRMRARRGDN